MSGEIFHPAFIGPGGPELIVVMLVLILMFGAKDAPRIFRSINEMINRMRTMADTVKREVLYADLYDDTESDALPYETEDQADDHDEATDAEDTCDDVETDEDGESDAKPA
jgi:sec-independent protein translocase protein TatA